ncbi:MAG: penicillin-binding transpeptidase domain-containing protein, partial [Bacilli bacterium]
QQVAAVSGIINGGSLLTPFVVKTISEPVTNQVVIEHKKNIKKENIVSKETSDLVKYVLESVVARGGGHHAYIENYRVGGKTGTAQKVGEDHKYMIGNYILSFIGFIPADKPQYIGYVAVDNPHGAIQYGGSTSAPIVKKIFENIINLYDLKEDKTGLPKEYMWYEQKYIELPHIEGMDKKEARNLLTPFVVEYSGSGNKIISVVPRSGTRIKEGSTVKVMLNEE